MRMSVNVLSAFSVALTLSVARVHRFQDPVSLSTVLCWFELAGLTLQLTRSLTS